MKTAFAEPVLIGILGASGSFWLAESLIVSPSLLWHKASPPSHRRSNIVQKSSAKPQVTLQAYAEVNSCYNPWFLGNFPAYFIDFAGCYNNGIEKLEADIYSSQSFQKEKMAFNSPDSLGTMREDISQSNVETEIEMASELNEARKLFESTIEGEIASVMEKERLLSAFTKVAKSFYALRSIINEKYEMEDDTQFQLLAGEAQRINYSFPQAELVATSNDNPGVSMFEQSMQIQEVEFPQAIEKVKTLESENEILRKRIRWLEMEFSTNAFETRKSMPISSESGSDENKQFFDKTTHQDATNLLNAASNNSGTEGGKNDGLKLFPKAPDTPIPQHIMQQQLSLDKSHPPVKEENSLTASVEKNEEGACQTLSPRAPSNPIPQHVLQQQKMRRLQWQLDAYERERSSIRSLAGLFFRVAAKRASRVLVFWKNSKGSLVL